MIYVTGDIHGEIDISKLNTQNFSQAKAGDYLIVCGDFGLIWDMKPSRAEEYWMKWLSEKPWITLFVDGNHENFDRLKTILLQKNGVERFRRFMIRFTT